KRRTPPARLATPCLIARQAPTFQYASTIAIPADELVPFQATTTAVSAGDAGANNFAAYRRFIVASTRTRLYAFVHIANIGLAGFPVGELFNIDFAQIEPPRARWRRTPTLRWASRCACPRTSSGSTGSSRSSARSG